MRLGASIWCLVWTGWLWGAGISCVGGEAGRLWRRCTGRGADVGGIGSRLVGVIDDVLCNVFHCELGGRALAP